MIIAAMHSLSLHSSPNPWLIRLVTFLLAALAAASLSYWVLTWPAPTAARALTPEPAAPAIDTAKVAQLLGANPNAAGPQAATVSAPSKYKLLGVIAEGAHGGSALIAIDSEPAKPYRIGEHLSDTLVLKSVKARSVTLAAGLQDNGGITLELPPLPGAP
jgi:general secretion pathway protein C